MAPANPLQHKFSPTATSEDSPFINSEEPLKKPRRSLFFEFGRKLVPFSAALSPVLLLLLIFKPSIPSNLENNHTTRTIFGDIPWTWHPFGGDDNFLHADPYDGQAWTLYKNQLFDSERQSTVWDDVYPSNFIVVENPEQFGFQGGVNLSAEARDPTDFVAGSEGFGLAFLHQMHCLGAIKHYLSRQHRSDMTDQQYTHTDHCIEVLRQFILCKADLSVQRPKGLPSSTRWPPQEQHVCRDQRVLMEAIWSRAIVKADGGWIRRSR